MVQYFPVITGSLTVTGSVFVSGSITATGGVTISGSIDSASYAANAERLDNLDSTSFVFTSSYNQDSSSFSTRTTNLETASGSFSTRVTTIESKYATTGSNIFTANQTICGNLTTTGTITAQTINVQQVTSSIVYSSGSNIFGCSLANTQQLTGSVTITGSLVVTTTAPELTVGATGVTLGNVVSDVHQVTGSMFITGSNIRANVSNACFSSTICSCANSTIYAYFDGSSTVLPNPTDRPHIFRLANGGLGISANNEGVSSQPIRMYTCGQERITVATNGNVGLGIVTPCTALHISSATPYIYLTDTNTAGTRPTSKLEAGDVGTCQSLTFSFSCNDIATCDIKIMTLTERGNVGIGTSSPSALLEVYGLGGTSPNSVIKVTGTTNYAFFRTTNTSGDFYIGTDNSTGTGFGLGNYSRLLWSEGNYPLIFAVNSAERMRITPSGSVGIGQTSPSFMLEVRCNTVQQNVTAAHFAGCNYGNNCATYIQIGTQYSGGDGSSRIGSRNSTSNYSDLVFETHTGTSGVWSERMRIDYNGNVGIGTCTPNFALEVCKTDGSVRFGTNTRHVLFCSQTSTGNISYTGFRYDDNGLVEVVKLLNNYSGTGYGNAIGFYGNGDKQMGYIKVSQTDASNTQAKMVIGVRCNDGAYDALSIFQGAVSCFAGTVCASNFIAAANGTVQACRIYTGTSDIAVNNGTFTTIFTSTGSGGVWLVSFTLNGNPSQVGYAIVGNAFGNDITLLAGSTGSQTCIKTSGLNLQVCQTSGANLTARVSNILLTSILA